MKLISKQRLEKYEEITQELKEKFIQTLRELNEDGKETMDVIQISIPPLVSVEQKLKSPQSNFIREGHNHSQIKSFQ